MAASDEQQGQQSSSEQQPQPQQVNGRSGQAPQAPPQAPPHASPRWQPRVWRDVVEEQLAEARERGEFDNLRGTGKPLNLEKNLFAGDKALAYSLLQNNGLAPPEIERVKEIDADLVRAEALLVALRRQRDALLARARPFASERRAYNTVRDKTAQRYTEALRAINSKILSLNIVAPTALHRRTVDIQARLDAFASEFPPMAT